MTRLCTLGTALALVLCSAPNAGARVGFGDPVADYREHRPGERWDLHAALRLRGALYGNLDLDRGVSPSSGEPLWPKGEGTFDLTSGGDLRLRLRPTIWLGDDVRIVMDVDMPDNVSLGASPRGTPYAGRAAIVTGTAFQEPLNMASGYFTLRSAYGEANTPLGVVAAGRMPSHFGMGIAANDGDGIDDDLGDRADRVAFVTPVLGHFLAAALDVAATGPRMFKTSGAPQPQVPSLAQPALSVALVRYRAPWEVDVYRWAGDWLVDYGVALSAQWQRNDAPVYYQSMQGTNGFLSSQRVARNYAAAVADGWARLVWREFRLEAEAVVSQLWINNPSPYPGIEMRKPITGNPFGGVVVAEWLPMHGFWEVLGEVGVASPDPAPGFPIDEPSSFSGAQAGDVMAPQFDGTTDTRLDAYRFHPAYHVDLILWRTLLGGVSEAAYVRTRLANVPFKDLRFEFNAVYSHGLLARSTPGGIKPLLRGVDLGAPLGVEFDSAAVATMGAFQVRADAGLLMPMSGMGKRGGHTSLPAEMFLLRIAYAR